jgi:hypothetical protein
MRILGAISISILILFFVTSAPAYSQDQDEARPGQAQEEKDKARHEDKATKQDENKHEQEQPGARQEEHPGKPEAAPPKREQGEQRQQMERDNHQHPVQAQHGKRIPDDKFRASFGPQHTFLVQRTQVINVSQPVIVYSGYSFELVDVWPAEWAFDDPCYVDFVDDEYFLFDTFHPGVRIALIVIG